MKTPKYQQNSQNWHLVHLDWQIHKLLLRLYLHIQKGVEQLLLDLGLSRPVTPSNALSGPPTLPHTLLCPFEPPLMPASGFRIRVSAALLASAQPSVISHPASQYWLGVLEAYPEANSQVTDCVLPRTLSLHSTQEGQQNFLGDVAGRQRLDSRKLWVQSGSQMWSLEQRRKKRNGYSLCGDFSPFRWPVHYILPFCLLQFFF